MEFVSPSGSAPCSHVFALKRSNEHSIHEYPAEVAKVLYSRPSRLGAPRVWIPIQVEEDKVGARGATAATMSAWPELWSYPVFRAVKLLSAHFEVRLAALESEFLDWDVSVENPPRRPTTIVKAVIVPKGYKQPPQITDPYD